jgi:hypothetical protein
MQLGVGHWKGLPIVVRLGCEGAAVKRADDEVVGGSLSMSHPAGESSWELSGMFATIAQDNWNAGEPFSSRGPWDVALGAAVGILGCG